VQSGDDAARRQASVTMKSIKQSCTDCHGIHRNL